MRFCKLRVRGNSRWNVVAESRIKHICTRHTGMNVAVYIKCAMIKGKRCVESFEET